MAETVSDFLVSAPDAWGVKRIYGYPGDGINGIMGALDRADGPIEFMQVRHEEMAAFMACAHAKFTGEVGVCLATSGPGAIHLLNGLYDAKLDHQPVVAIVGQSARPALGGRYQQEVDLLVAVQGRGAASTCRWRRRRTQVRHLIDRAIRIARSRAHRHLHHHSQRSAGADAVEKPPRKHGTIHSGVGLHERRASFRSDADLRARGRRAQRRRARWRCWSAQGRCGATDEVIEVADMLGAGIAKALLGKAAVPDDLPFVTGSIGLLGTEAELDDDERVRHAADGRVELSLSGVPARGGQGARRADRHRRPDAAHALSDGGEPRRRQRGDAARAAAAAAAQDGSVVAREDRDRTSRDWWERDRSARDERRPNPINPQRVFWELSPRLPDDCILSADSGTAASWYARDLKIRRGMMAIAVRQPGDDGPGGAVRDRREVRVSRIASAIALRGDGAMQMNGHQRAASRSRSTGRSGRIRGWSCWC